MWRCRIAQGFSNSEGISSPDDLVDFDEDAIIAISVNLRRSGGNILDLNPSAATGDTMPASLFMLRTRSQMKLGDVRDIARFYATVRRDTPVTSIR